MRKKGKNIFQTLNNLSSDEIKIFMVLERLSEKKGYSYITPKSLSKNLNIDEKTVQSSIYNLIKKGAVFFIDLKDKDKLLERRFYTDKFKFFNDSRKKDELVPTRKEVNDLKQKLKSEDEAKKVEAEKKLKEIELNGLVEEYWENMDSIKYMELYEKAEDKYSTSIYGEPKPLSDFQAQCFEKLAPIYMKMIIKEELAKDLNYEIPDYFDTEKKTNAPSKVSNTFDEKLKKDSEEVELYK